MQMHAVQLLSTNGQQLTLHACVQGVGQDKVSSWLEETGMDAEDGAVVLKPAEAAFSINVRFAFGMQDAIEQAHDLLANEDARLVCPQRNSADEMHVA